MAVDVLRCRSCPSSVTDDVITHLLNVRTFDVYSNHVTKTLCKTPVCLKINIFHFHFSLHAPYFFLLQLAAGLLLASVAMALAGDVIELDLDDFDHTQDGLAGRAVTGEYKY